MNKLQSLPRGFREEMISTMGEEETIALIDAIEQTLPPVSIRLHPQKSKSVLVDRMLPFAEYFTGNPPDLVPWSGGAGIYLPQRPLFTADPLMHAGAYYVQEASSMALALLRPFIGEKPLVALDLCAAPGGKSTLLMQLLPEGSLLLANELIFSRANILSENLRKWGLPNVICSSADPSELAELGSSFDLILCDVPCSGEGMFRKSPDNRSEWTPAVMKQSAVLAREITDAAWRVLKPGGLLIFSTCTYNKTENEENLAYLLNKEDAESVQLPDLNTLPKEIVPAFAPVSGTSVNTYALRLMPHRTRGEGLFLGLVRKKEDAESIAPSIPIAKYSKTYSGETLPTMVKHWIRNPEHYVFRTLSNGLLHAIPEQMIPLLERLTYLRIRLLSVGIELGELKGRNYVPSTSLALSSELEFEAFPHRDLCREEALLYLRREAIALPPEASKGFLVMTYAGLPVGFVKNLGTRANNLYPKEWRIRMDIRN